MNRLILIPTTMKKRIARLIISLFGLSAVSAFGAGGSSLNILWYTGGAEPTYDASFTTYQDAINNLVSQENSAFNVSGSVNTWNVTTWTGGAMPTGTFNVLVAASPEGGWSSDPSYTALTSTVSSANFGDRVMLTGQDADWHYMNGPGTTPFDGPAGFLIDAINWAGSGTGMGGVFLGNTGLGLFSGVGTDSGSSDTVDIPGAFSSYPINAGLTSAGLSNWGTSAHDTFVGADPSLWTAINVDGGGDPITIVSKATASGGTGTTTYSAPDTGSTALLCLLGVAALFAARRYVGRTLDAAN